MTESSINYDDFYKHCEEMIKKIDAAGPILRSLVITTLVQGYFKCNYGDGDYILMDKASWLRIEREHVLQPPPEEINNSICYPTYFTYRGVEVIENDELARDILKKCVAKWLREHEEKSFGPFPHLDITS